MVRVRVRVTAALEKVCTISVLLLVNVLLCHDLAQKLEVTSFALRQIFIQSLALYTFLQHLN